MQATIRVLDSSGDAVHKFDLEAESARRQAKALLDKLQGEGRALFKVDPATGEGTEKIGSVEKLGEENIAIPRLVGG